MIAQLKSKLDEANEFIGNQRLNYMKELNHLKDLMNVSSHIKYKGYQFIDVKYYDPTELTDSGVRKLINQKVEFMRNKYEMEIVSLDQKIAL